MKKYKVVDDYEMDWECIGYADTFGEIRKIAHERYLDTDSECAIYYYPLNEETGKYKRSEAKFMETY